MLRFKKISLALLAIGLVSFLPGCGGGGGGGGGGSGGSSGGGGTTPPSPVAPIISKATLTGSALRNETAGKASLMKFSDTGVDGSTISGNPASGYYILLLNGGTELDRAKVAADGSYTLSFDPKSVGETDRLTLRIVNGSGQIFTSLQLMPLTLEADRQYRLNLEWRPNIPDVLASNRQAMVVYLTLPNNVAIVADNAIDSDGDGVADTVGARIDYADNYIQFDRDMNGVFGEPGDVVLYGVAASIFDNNLADGYQNNPGDRRLAVSNVQETVGHIFPNYRPESIVGNNATEFNATLEALVTSAGGDSLYGARIRFGTDVGAFDGANSVVVTIDPSDPRVSFNGHGVARINLTQTFPAGTTGRARVEATTDLVGLVAQATAALTINSPQNQQIVPPSVLAVSPASGSLYGDEERTIMGENFQSGATVFFGDRPATSVTVVSGARIVCTTPFGTAGMTNITVVNPDGGSATLADGYRYIPPAITVTQSGGSTDIAEGGNTDSYSIALNTKPLSTVKIAVAADAQSVVVPSVLTFTAANWNVPQSVTVGATDDDSVEGTHASLITHSVTSADPFYHHIAATDVTAHIVDNDAAGVTIAETGGSTNVVEGGATDSYTVILTSQPTADVTVTITPDSQCSTDKAIVTFTPANWNTAQTVTVAAVNNLVVDSSRLGTITHAAASADTNYNAIVITNVAVHVADNDVAGVVILQSNASTLIAEGGAMDAYSLILSSKPVADVVVTISPNSQCVVDKSIVTFTPANWNSEQVVTVTAVDDVIAEGNHTGSIAHVVASADGNYHSIAIANIVADISDNDTPGVTVVQSGGSTDTVEGNVTDSYTIVLDRQPLADVVVTIAPDAQCTTDKASITFTPANWNTAQTVTVTAVDDAVAEGNHTGMISHSAASAATNYNGIAIANIVVSIIDNDTAGVVVTQSGGSTNIAEGGATDSYTIVLSSQPTGDVTVTITPDAQCTTDKASTTFTPANWNTAQTVTVTAVNDDVAEGSHTGTIAHSAASSDANYNGATIESVIANITDNDVAGVTIAQSGGSTDVAEGGVTDSYTVVLNSQPTDDVTVTISPDAQSSTDIPNVMFTPANWNAPQTVMVTAVNNSIIDGSRLGTITHGVASADGNYSGIVVGSVIVNITDNDIADIALTPSGGSTDVAEGGASDSYTIVLTSQPTTDVTITITPDGQCTVDKASVTFTAANWNTPQTVAITAVNDAIAEGSHTSAIAHSATSTDANYNGIAGANLVANITDDDAPAVMITRTDGSTNVTEDGATDSYTIVLTSQPTADVIVTVAPGAQCTVDALTVTFTSINWNAPQTVTISAVNDLIAEGSHTGTIAHSASSVDVNYNAIAVANVVASIADNDSPGVVIAQSGGSTDVTEGSVTDSYTIVLMSQPTADIVITVSHDTQCTTNKAAITFTSADWNTPQTVTVSAINDQVAEGAHTGTVTHSVASADANYNAIVTGNVVAHITDNDTAGATISQSGGATNIVESGAGDSYNIVLKSQPTSNVVITLSPDSQCKVSPTKITFTPYDWFMAKPIGVSAVNEAIAEGPHTGTITHSVASADVNYNGMAIANVTANITEIYTAKITGSIIGDVQSGVTMTMSGPVNATTISAADGSYSFAGLPNGTYTVAPKKANFAFSPTSITGINILNGDVVLQTVIASAVNIEPLAFQVTDAEYSDSLNKIIIVSANPNQLHSYDPETKSEMAVALTWAPKCVSVSPDGTRAAVGHDGRITYINLTTGETIATFNVTAIVWDIILAGNGFIYGFPDKESSGRVHCIEIATGVETLPTGLSVSDQTHVRLHPNGNYIYGIYSPWSTSTFNKYDIRGGTASSPSFTSHPSFPINGNIWIGKDGKRIFTCTSNVFNSSTDPSIEFSYYGAMSKTTAIQDMSHNSSKGLIAVIDSAQDYKLQWYRYSDLVYKGETSLSSRANGAGTYYNHGKFVFSNETLGVAYTIVQADPSLGLVNGFAVLRNQLPTFANAGTNRVVFPNETITLNGGRSIDLGGVPLTYSWSQLSGPAVALDNPASSQPSFTAPTNDCELIFQLTANNGVTTATSSVTVTVRADGTFRFVSFQVTDAEYSDSLGKIIIVSSAPAQLHIYDPETKALTSLDLTWDPTCLSVSSDGTKAAVGHNGKITYVNLCTAETITTFDVTDIVYDLVLAGNGYIYVIPERDSRIHCFEVSSGTKTVSAYNASLWRNRVVLHPGGNYIYLGSPNGADKYNIQSGTAIQVSSSPSVPYFFSSMKWIGKDGTRLFSNDGKIFKSSTNPATDMVFSGILDKTSTVQGISHDNSRGVLAVADGIKIRWYHYEDLAHKGVTDYPRYTTGPTDNTYGKFIFCNETLGVAYSIVHTYSNSNPLPNVALIRHQLPILANAGGNQVVFTNETVSLDGTRSFHCGGLPLNYSWAQVSGTAVALTDSIASQPAFVAPAVEGDIVFQLTVTDGIVTATSNVTISVKADGALRFFAFQIVDAKYSNNLNKIIMVSSDPHLLHIYNPETKALTSISLAWTPKCVSVSPDGMKAAVGHDGKITYVDLASAAIVTTFDVSFFVSDIVLAGDGYIYVPFRRIEISTGLEASFPNFADVTAIKLHPNGNVIQGIDSSSYIKKFSIQGGTISPIVYPSDRNYPLAGNFWISKDGLRIIGRSKSVFKSSFDPSIDMTRNGSLGQTTTVQDMSHDNSRGVLAVIDQSQNQKLQWYRYKDLTYNGETVLAKYSNGATTYDSHGKYNFCNETLGVVYSVIQVDNSAGLTNNIAVVRNQVPVFADAGICRVVLTNETVVLNGTGSNGPAGTTLTYSWSQLSGPLVSLDNPNSNQPSFTPPVGGGDMIFELTVSDGTFTDTSTVKISARTNDPMWFLDFRITDAEYSNSLNKIIIVSADPPRLNIYDPETKTATFINLMWTPKCISVSPDGTKAAIGHDGKVTYVDLTTASIINTFSITAPVWDVVLAGNGYIYAFPESEQSIKIHCIEIATGTESATYSISQRTYAKLHPSGNYIYDTCNQDSTNFKKYDIRGGTATNATVFPYNFYSINGNLWIAKDGSHIFARSGNVFRSSTDTAIDMTYNGYLSQTTTVKDLTHDSIRGIMAIINEDQDQKLQWYRYADLTYKGETIFTKYSNGITDYDIHGKFVFCNETLGVVYTLVQVDSTAGLVADFALLRNQPPVFANAGAKQLVLTNNTVTLDGTRSIGLSGDALTYSWVQLSGPPVALDNASSSRPSFTAPAADGDIVFQLTVSNGAFTSASTVTISVQADGPMRFFAIQVVDAEYSSSLNKIVMVSDNPPRLTLYDPETKIVTSVNLAWTPKCVSVSPNGTKAAIGHAGRVTYVDLTTASIINTFDTTTIVWDILLSGNGYIYVFPEVDLSAKIHHIETATGKESLPTTAYIDTRSRIKLHPAENYIYGVTATSSYFMKYDIADGVAKKTISSPQYSYYPINGNFWISKDGQRIFVGGGAIFKSSADPAIDLTYNGSLNPTSKIKDLGHDKTREVIVVIDETQDQELQWYRYADLTYKGDSVLTKYSNGTTTYNSHGKFVFCNEALGVVYTIVQVDSTAGLTNNIAVVRNQLPVFAHAGGNQLVLVNDTVTLDGTGSIALGGAPLTYSWVQLSGPVVVLDNPASNRPSFTAPAVDGDIVFQLTVSDGALTNASNVTVAIKNDGPMRFLGFQVTDAEYSNSMNKIVMVSDNPPRLTLYDPETKAMTSVNLAWAPKCVSVSPDGTKAAIGHDAKITYIDLSTGSVLKVFDISVVVWDILLAQNSFIYVMGANDQWTNIRCVNIPSGVETLQTGNSVHDRTNMRLHPSGDYIYGLYNLYYSNLRKIDIRNGTGKDITPYPYPVTSTGNLWISKDGKRIFLRNGIALRASADPAIDMSYNGSLSQTTLIKDASNDNIKGIMAVVSETQDQKLQWYHYADLTYKGDSVLAKYSNGTTEYNSHGRFVFCNETLGVVYTIVQVDSTAGLTNDIAVVRNQLPIFAHAGGNQVVLTNDTVALDGTRSVALGGAPLTYSWVQLSGPVVVLDNPASNRPSFTAPAVDGDIVFQLTVSDGALTNASNVTVAVKNDGPMRFLGFQVTDAEYSNSLNKIVMVSDNPPRLTLYDPETKAMTSVNLAWAPKCVSVSPDGTKAAIGHDAKITYVDLTTASVINTFGTTAIVWDIVLAGNGFVYAFPEEDQNEYIRCIGIGTGTESLQTGNSIYERTHAKLHPSGDYIYSTCISTTDYTIKKFDIQGGTANNVTPYPSSSFPAYGNLWIGKNGDLIFGRSGNVYNASAITYFGSLSLSGYVREMDHSQGKDLVTVIPESNDTSVLRYQYSTLVYQGSDPIPQYNLKPCHGKFVFFRSDGSKYYVLFQVDTTAGLTFDNGVTAVTVP